MGLSSSVSWTIQLIVGMGQMLTKDNSEIIIIIMFINAIMKGCNNERVISYQPMERWDAIWADTQTASPWDKY